MADAENMGNSALAEVPAEPVAADIGPDDQSVRWTASEFIAHHKPPGWYAMLAAGSLVLGTLIFLLTRDVVSVGVVIVAGLLLSIYGARQPRQLEYVVSPRGVGVGGKYHNYGEFRSFSVASEGAFSSIVFMPLKRFAVPLTVYYAPADEEKILGIISDQLPLEEHREDAIDSFMRRIRF